MENSGKPKILVAAAPHSSHPIVRALGEGFESTTCGTLADAHSHLRAKPDLIVCGLYFDESRMFDFLRYAKADPVTQSIPFLSVKATEGELTSTLFQGIEIACKALGAERFIDLARWKYVYGEEAAHKKFQSIVAQLASAS